MTSTHEGMTSWTIIIHAPLSPEKNCPSGDAQLFLLRARWEAQSLLGRLEFGGVMPPSCALSSK